jgi:mRNA-degrading endonuclease RelE of RelBE toxin-antitoxin system
MPFRITITEDAEQQLLMLSAREQRILQAAIASRLLHQPTALSLAIRRLRPNPIAEYELRVGGLRILYDVEGEEVIISVVGKKIGKALFVAGEEFRGHQDCPPEPSGNGPEGHPE